MGNVFGVDTDGLNAVRGLLEGLITDLHKVGDGLSSELADAGSPFSDDAMGQSMSDNYKGPAEQVSGSAKKLTDALTTTADNLAKLAAGLAQTEGDNTAAIGAGAGG